MLTCVVCTGSEFLRLKMLIVMLNFKTSWVPWIKELRSNVFHPSTMLLISWIPWMNGLSSMSFIQALCCWLHEYLGWKGCTSIIQALCCCKKTELSRTSSKYIPIHYSAKVTVDKEWQKGNWNIIHWLILFFPPCQGSQPWLQSAQRIRTIERFDWIEPENKTIDI